MIARAICLAALALGSAAGATPPFRQVPAPGVRHYRYTVLQTINRTTQRGYRADFDLVAGADGSVDAIMFSSEALAGGTWTPVTVPPACRAAMHGSATILARVRLCPCRRKLPRISARASSIPARPPTSSSR